MNKFSKIALKSTAAISAVLMLSACGGSGDDAAAYPEKDITFIVPYGTGGSTDPLAREYARQLEEKLGVTVRVENREGGSATIGTSDIVNADPDGYTIGMSSNSALSYQPLVNQQLVYTSPEDYHLVAKLVDLPAVLAVPKNSPFNNLQEFVDYAKQNPGKVRVSQSGAMTTGDIVLQQLIEQADLDVRSVPFSGGGGEATLAAVSGRVEATSGFAAGINGLVDSGDLKVIGAFDDEAYKLFPDATPISELGYNATIPASYYVIAPKDLPAEIVTALNEVSKEIVEGETMKTFADVDGYVLDYKTHEAAATELNEYAEQYKVVKEAMGVKAK